MREKLFRKFTADERIEVAGYISGCAMYFGMILAILCFSTHAGWVGAALFFLGLLGLLLTIKKQTRTNKEANSGAR